jgi:hypothetical protein
MNTWKYMYTAATPVERDEITLLLLQRLQARSTARVWVSGRLLLDRRRSPRYHFISDRRQRFPSPWWWPFTPPIRQRTPQVHASALFGMTLVLLTALIHASTGQLSALLLVPGYGLFVCLVLFARQRTLTFTLPRSA